MRLSIQEPRFQPARVPRPDAGQKRDDRGEPDQADRPRQGLRDDRADRGREVRHRGAQVTGQPGCAGSRRYCDHNDWLVSVPRSASMSVPHLRRHRAVHAQLGDHDVDRVARHEPRDEEVHRHRRPQRDQVEPELAEQIAHVGRRVTSAGFRLSSTMPLSHCFQDAGSGVLVVVGRPAGGVRGVELGQHRVHVDRDVRQVLDDLLLDGRVLGFWVASSLVAAATAIAASTLAFL